MEKVSNMEGLSNGEVETEKKESFKFKIGQVNLDTLFIERSVGSQEIIVKILDLDNGKGEKRSILDFLPKGWEVVLDRSFPQESAVADLLRRKIKLPTMHMAEKKWRLAENETPPEDVRIENKNIFGRSFYDKKFIKRLGVVRELKYSPIFQDNPNILLTLLHEIGHIKHKNNQNLPEDFHERDIFLNNIDRSQQEKISEERDVWAFAIKTIKQLRDQGFDFGDVFNQENVLKQIDYPLSSYGDKRKNKKI